MSIVPAARLSPSDLSHLGNNLRRRDGRRTVTGPRTAESRRLAAVNRSLAGLGERVARLHRPPVTAA